MAYYLAGIGAGRTPERIEAMQVGQDCSAGTAQARLVLSFMTTTSKARRIAYRKQARADLCRPGFWLFATSLYGITFGLVTSLAFVGRFIAIHFFHSSPSAFSDPIAAAFWWANLIEVCFLIAIAVLFVWGGWAWTPFRSPPENDHAA